MMSKQVIIIYFEVLILAFGGGMEANQPSVLSTTWKKLESWNSRLVTIRYGHNIPLLGVAEGCSKSTECGVECNRQPIS
jgi:hypothetical protein